MSSKQTSKEAAAPAKPSGPSWGMMLTLLLIAIVVASLIAYRMIYPFFHQHPR